MIKFRKCVEDSKPYIPGKPIDDVKKEYNLSNVIKIASNENPYGCSKKVIEAIKNNLNTPQLYPDGNCTFLREKLAGKLNVSKNNLIFGCGEDELISLLSKAIINEGDECITAETTFSQYAASVNSMGGKVIYSKMKNFGFDLDDILTKISDKTKIIFISNPNNPTGTVFSEKEQSDFLKQVPKNIIVVFDEAYAEFADGFDFPNTLHTLSEYENAVLLKTFSKVYGLASFRIGYAVSSPYIISNLEKIRNPFNVSSFAQIAAFEALDDTDFINYTIENNTKVKNYLYDELKKINLNYIPTYTNFIMIDVKQDSKTVFKKLMEKGYIIRPGYAFEMDTYLRVTFGTMDEMKGFIKVLAEILQNG